MRRAWEQTGRCRGRPAVFADAPGHDCRAAARLGLRRRQPPVEKVSTAAVSRPYLVTSRLPLTCRRGSWQAIVLHIIIALLAPGVEVIALQTCRSAGHRSPSLERREIDCKHLVNDMPVRLEMRIRATIAQGCLPLRPGGFGLGNLPDEVIEPLAGRGLDLGRTNNLLSHGTSKRLL